MGFGCLNNIKLFKGSIAVVGLTLISSLCLAHEGGNHPKLPKPNSEISQNKKNKNPKSQKPKDQEQKDEDNSGSVLTGSQTTEIPSKGSDNSVSNTIPSIIIPAGSSEVSRTQTNIGDFVSGSSSSTNSVASNLDPISPPAGEPEEALEKSQKALTDLVERANKNVETSVASNPEELKNGDYNANDGITSLSSITYHTNNEALCLKSRGNGKADGAACEEWLDKDISDHGTLGDSSPLERGIYQLWEGAKNKISETAYRIWDIALKAKETLLDRHGRLNTNGLAKFELNDQAREVASELGSKSAEQALKNALGKDAPKDGEIVAPPPEALRAIAVNVSRAIVNQATSKWSEIQTAKEGVEVINSVERNNKKYRSDVENEENNQSLQEGRLLNQAPLDTETEGLTLEERTARAEALKNVGTDMVNPRFDGNTIVPGNPNKERIDEWAYRATVEQMANPFITSNEIQRPDQIQLSERQISAQLASGEESDNSSEQKVSIKNMTPKEQIAIYNRQLEIAAKNMEAIAAESSSFVNTAGKIRTNKLKEGESILTINDLTPIQKKELNQKGTSLAQNPNTKVEIPRTASQLTITRY